MNYAVYTQETDLGFCISAGEERLGTLPIKHARSSQILCFCTYAARGVHRRKWLGGHLAPPPNHDLEVRAPSFIQWFRWVICEMRNLKTPLDCHLKCTFQMTHRNEFGVHTVQNTVFRILIQNAHFDLTTILTCKPNVCDYHSTMQQV